MPLGGHGKDPKRRRDSKGRLIAGAVAAETALLVLFGAAFLGGWYAAAVVLLVLGFAVVPLIVVLLPLFRKG